MELNKELYRVAKNFKEEIEVPPLTSREMEHHTCMNIVLRLIQEKEREVDEWKNS